jgi:hypothetical protein
MKATLEVAKVEAGKIVKQIEERKFARELEQSGRVSAAAATLLAACDPPEEAEHITITLRFAKEGD